MPRLLIHFARYGPYHHARLRAAHEVLAPLGWEVLGLEIAGTDATYAWEESKGGDHSPGVITVFPGEVYEDIRRAAYRKVLPPLLESLKPDAMLIAGWGSIDAVLCLSWCRRHNVRRFVMSETRAVDGHRVWWKELVKRHFVSHFDGALVGGRSHRDYLVGLGMKQDRIAFGYNVVDNDFFASEAREARARDAKQSPELPPFFLSSNRFVPRKNLERLLEAYAAYGRSFQASTCGLIGEDTTSARPWNLCLLGNGELKASLLAKCGALGLRVIESAPWETELLKTGDAELNTHPNSGVVWMPGFRQIAELPRFYAHAGAFIHPALEEPWGLVINEAMACGLPVLSGDNVGAAEELIEDGVNGWTFDAGSVDEMAKAMRKVACLNPEEVTAMGEASVRMLEERGPVAAFGMGLSALLSSGIGATG